MTLLSSWRGNLDGDEETNDAEDDDVKLERERVTEGRTKRSVLTIKNLAKVPYIQRNIVKESRWQIS